MFLKVPRLSGFYYVTNEAISYCRFFAADGSYERVSIEAISDCRFLKVEGSYMRGFTV